MKNFEYKKSLGQNFLIDQNINNKIIGNINLKENSLIIEVGAGSGALTKELIKLNAKVISFEIDKRLEDILGSIDANNLEIINEDFLKANLENILNKNSYKHLYFIANIPYYITTPIINKIYSLDAEEIIIMIQKEVAEKLSSKPNTKEYNSLNVLLGYNYEIEKIMNVSANSFYPKPNVDSAIIKLTKKYDKEKLINYNHFYKLVKDSFKYKRKNLKNNLKSYDLSIIEKTLKKFDKDLTCRAESLSVEEFVNISNALN